MYSLDFSKMLRLAIQSFEDNTKNFQLETIGT